MPLTFADFALSEARFRKHFKMAPRDTWNDDMIPLTDFIELSEEDREGKFPFVWAVDKKGRLSRVICAKPLVRSTEDRRDFWLLLRSLVGKTEKVDTASIVNQAKAEVAQQLVQGLLQIAGMSGAPASAVAPMPVAAPASTANITVTQESKGESVMSADGYAAPRLDSNECTGCGECVMLNPNIFAWNDKKQAYIKDPNGGSYKDLVKAAEKCAARCISPGLPADRSEKGVDKLIARAEKFNG